MKVESILDLLRELQRLDRVPRMGYCQRGVDDPESVSEHGFHVAFLVWALAREIPGVDTLRALELALVHDLAEVRFGDLPRTAGRYLPPGAKAGAELAALVDMLAPLSGQPAELLREYQTAETPEAKLVSVCDKLQLLVKASVYEEWNSGAMEPFWSALDRFDDAGFEPVAQVVAELKAHRRAAFENRRSGR